MEGENKIKNKIITISGEPVTGKGTTVKALQEKLVQKGYKEDNIHIIITGHEFRKLFFVLLDFISHIEDEELLKQLSEKEEIKAILEDPVYRIKFISVVAKLKSQKMSISSDITIEQANNIPELAELRTLVDTMVDENVEKLGKEINQIDRPDEVWIIDSRLAFQNIPDSFSVRLTCMPHIAGKRLMGDNTRGKEDSSYESLEIAIEQREKRKEGEVRRYKERYGVDLTDEDNYDLVIDTSFATVDDISNTILLCLDRYVAEKEFPRNWTSPKMLLPRQGERDTLGESLIGYSIEDMRKIIKEEGYNIDYPIDIIEVDGIKYIIEGHHRSFASGNIGLTLVPYVLVGKDDELKELYSRKYGKNTPKTLITRCGNRLKHYAISHEWILEGKTGERFSYRDAYPGIFEKFEQYEAENEKNR